MSRCKLQTKKYTAEGKVIGLECKCGGECDCCQSPDTCPKAQLFDALEDETVPEDVH